MFDLSDIKLCMSLVNCWKVDHLISFITTVALMAIKNMRAMLLMATMMINGVYCDNGDCHDCDDGVMVKLWGWCACCNYL